MADQRATFERPSPGFGESVRPHRTPPSLSPTCGPLTFVAMALACGPGPKRTVRRYEPDEPRLAGLPLRAVSTHLQAARTGRHASATGSRP
jgi:hypothetical protein